MTGSELQRRRREVGLRQSDLADLSGVSLRTIVRIENDQVEPNRSTVNLLDLTLAHYEKK